MKGPFQKRVFKDPPIYFGVAMWGKPFCKAFVEYCLLSLLASGNIPALPNLKNKNKFLFCTTLEDWGWLQSHPHFILLSQYITPELVPIHLISEEEYQKLGRPLAYKLHIVTEAHTALVSRMHRDRCIGSLVFPDTIYAKNALKSVYPHILEKDKKAVLVHFPRFAIPELLQDLSEQGYIKAPTPIEIENRDLIKHALKHRNIELLAQNWKFLYTFDFITDLWWPLDKKGSMLCHSFMWCPVFINYSRLTSHNTECLKNNTIDGSYLYNNFTKDDFYLVTDSDEFVMISHSPHNNLQIKHKPGIIGRFSNISKIVYWREMITLCSGFVDPLKLELLKYPIFVHVNDLTQKEYQIKEKSQRIIQKILSRPNKLEIIFKMIQSLPIFIKAFIKDKVIPIKPKFYWIRAKYYWVGSKIKHFVLRYLRFFDYS